MLKKCIQLQSMLRKHCRIVLERGSIRNDILRYGNFSGVLSKSQLREAEEFWGRYTKHFSPLWHELLTAKTGVFNVRYVPEDIHFTEIEPRINILRSDYGIDDKNNYRMYFPEVRHPKSVFRKMNNIYHADDYTIISEEEALANCEACGDIILKMPKQYCAGHGIRFWRREDGKDVLINIIRSMGTEINAEEYVHQHPDMGKMNPNSCNTIRVMTYANQKGVRVICAYYQVAMKSSARMGKGIDGGVCVSIRADGTLMPNAYDKNYNAYEIHSSGIAFAGYKIPSFQTVCDTACNLHQKIGDFRLISWDFTVGLDGEPIFIEMNTRMGGIMYHQLSNGPLYGDRTEEILNEIYGY